MVEQQGNNARRRGQGPDVVPRVTPAWHTWKCFTDPRGHVLSRSLTPPRLTLMSVVTCPTSHSSEQAALAPDTQTTPASPQRSPG